MMDFLDLCKETEKRLGRKVQEKELEFLQWVYVRYVEEQNKHSKDHVHGTDKKGVLR